MTDHNASYLGEDILKKDNEHEYYESYYRNSTENTKLSHFKDRWPVFLEIQYLEIYLIFMKRLCIEKLKILVYRYFIWKKML